LRPGFSLLALAAAVLTTAGCGRPAHRNPPDIVLVSIDTLRPDHLGCYGSSVPTSPNIDRFREQSVLFRTVVAQASSTLSSHASMLTSELPANHGASFAALRPLRGSVPTLAEVLSKAGYRTLAVTARGQLDPRFGIGRGFERYRADTEGQRPGVFARSVRRALRMMSKPDPRPTFLFLHTYEVHHPYTPDPAILDRLDPGYEGTLGPRIEVRTLIDINSGKRTIDAADARHIERAYDGEIVSVDRAFGQLLAGLEKRGGDRGTVVVLTSDHGEEFGEHGKMGWHSHTLFDELLHVPLVVRLPGGQGAGKTVDMQVRSIDIAPTLLELAGVEAPERFDGRSLMPLVRGERLRELPAISELDDGKAPLEGSNSLSWQGWKVYDRRLYDLAKDPGERADVALDHRDRVLELGRMLHAALAWREVDQTEKVRLDDEFKRELKALGYLN